MTPSTAEQIRLQLCGQCAKRAPGTARFCPRCGTRLRPGSPGDNTYLAVHKAIKGRSERPSEPLVIPRPVLPPSAPPKTPVLGYEPPTARRQQPPPRKLPPPKKKFSWLYVGLVVFALRGFVALSTSHDSHSLPNYPTPPIPPVSSFRDLPGYRFPAQPPAMPSTPAPPTPRTPPRPYTSPTLSQPPEATPRPIPGTSLSIDQHGHVIVNPPATPASPSPPRPPAAPASPSNRPSPHR